MPTPAERPSVCEMIATPARSLTGDEEKRNGRRIRPEAYTTKLLQHPNRRGKSVCPHTKRPLSTLQVAEASDAVRHRRRVHTSHELLPIHAEWSALRALGTLHDTTGFNT